MIEQTATVEKTSAIAEGSTEVVFALSKPLRFIAGQYITITLPSLAHLPEKEQSRDFSIVSAPEDSDRIAIAFRNSTSAFKTELLRKDISSVSVRMKGPRGIFTLPDTLTPSDSITFLAGGIGITPFLSMIRHIKNVPIDIKPTLFYYNRSRESAPYFSEIEAYGGNIITFIPTIGALTAESIKRYQESCKSNGLWYACGPRGLMVAARKALTEIGISDEFIKSEEFSGYT